MYIHRYININVYYTCKTVSHIISSSAPSMNLAIAESSHQQKIENTTDPPIGLLRASLGSFNNSQKVNKKAKRPKNYIKKSQIPFPLNFMHIIFLK